METLQACVSYNSISTLFIIQALRFITDDGYNTHHCDQYSKVEWPSLSNRRDRHWILFIFKTLSGLSPSYINSLVSFNASLYHTQSKDWLTLQVPSVNTELGKSSFSYCFTYNLEHSAESFETYLTFINGTI